MSMTSQLARRRASIRIDARLPEGHSLLCTGGGSDAQTTASLSIGSAYRSNARTAARLLCLCTFADFYQRGLDALASSLPDDGR